MRHVTAVCLGCAALLGGATYIAKQKVIVLEEQMATLTRQILVKQESHHLLRAEWTHLSCPERLQTLAESHLKMSPLQGWQVVSVHDVGGVSGGHRGTKGPVRLARAPTKHR